MKKYIGIDGIDGAGKSTITNLLKNHLENKYKVYVKKEPDQLRDIILEYMDNNSDDSGYILALLFTADRQIQNIELKKRIEEGYIVISDRTLYSTFSYQLIYNIDINWLKEISKYIIKPDITFILDISPEDAIERIEKRGEYKTYYERLGILNKVRDNFLKLKEIFPEDNIRYIDASKKPEEILNEIISYL
ncbi:thymidylate kinase [Nanobdella aerobiophila]|uniref:Probable thymidylate kinase n=1 Tax=Nanobdella aerobiophila TaxID=2586965 RepID=A0A915WSG9_9ARCH|nr:dTMP kinase [Nanobdella aerobiophila]BBL45192.1 thymidylate kinase [Nanobdella aerobiophila]